MPTCTAMQNTPSNPTLLEYRGRIDYEATCSTPVKNTFVHFESDEEDRHDAPLTRRKRRCVTAPQLQTLDEAVELIDTATDYSMSLCLSALGESDSSDESLCLPHGLSGLSDVDTFASTPTGSECDFSVDVFASSPAHRSLRQHGDLNLDALGSGSKDVFERPKQVREASGPQVLVQVPMTLPVDIAADAIGAVKATVLSISQSGAIAGEAIFDVRLRVCIPFVAPRATPTPLLLAEAVPAQPAGAPKSNSVCCHWKNKGWCAYKDTCKFLHPESRRGVGSAKLAVLNRPRGGNRQRATICA